MTPRSAATWLLRCHDVTGARSGTVVSLRRPAIALRLTLSLFLLGCSPTLQRSQFSAPIGFSGNVTGGQQPIAGSLIQLYAVGTSGDRSAATPLLVNPVTSSDGSSSTNQNANPGNANNSLPAGSFTISADYTCPSQSTQVYLVATGGNPGLTPGTNNPQIALMAILGPCGDLSPSTHINVNELTTVASIAPVTSFIGGYASLGSASSDASQFSAALSDTRKYTNTTTGTVPGPLLPSGYYASSYEIRALGDILATCIDSSGGVAGGNTPCGKLLQLATPPGGSAPADTIQAAINIVSNPTANVTSLFKLIPPSPPFQPGLIAAPASWTLSISVLPTTFSSSLNDSSFFIGASIINYWPLPLHKDGVVGETSSQVRARFSADVLNHGYKRVIILCGTNDVLQADPNLTTELPDNIQAMAVMANNAGIEVALSLLPPLSGSYSGLNANIISVNAAIAQLAAQHGYLLVDYYTPLAGHPEDLPDGIHPNATGYSVMEKALSGVVLF